MVWSRVMHYQSTKCYSNHNFYAAKGKSIAVKSLQTKDASYQQWSYLPLQYMIRARRLSDRMLLTSMFVPSKMVVKRCFMKCVPWLYGSKRSDQLTWSVTVKDATRMIGIIILYSFFSVMRPVVFVWSVWPLCLFQRG